MSEWEFRGAGAGRTVWLASFPKSGNTWLRAIFTAVQSGDRMFDVNQLSSGDQPHHVGEEASYSLGLDARWLDRAELLVLRDSLVRMVDRTTTGGKRLKGNDLGDVEALSALQANAQSEPMSTGLIFRKTHEAFRPGKPCRELFPRGATSAVILLVRDPRSVACSWAHFFGIPLDKTASMLGKGSGLEASPAQSVTDTPQGTWSSHCESWLRDDVPFPVHLVRFEDMRSNAVEALLPVLEAVGFEVARHDLEQAVERTTFERLAADELEAGFRETSPNADMFFRQGRIDGWRDELNADQIRRIESDHGEMMTRLGYELSSDSASRPDQVGLHEVQTTEVE